MVYSLIILLREEGLGYRKISRKLNQWVLKPIEEGNGLILLFLRFLKENMREMYCLMKFVIDITPLKSQR
jgi:hypothetical protein